MRLPRGIFVKLVGVFLLVGLVPFLGIEVWAYLQARNQLTKNVVESWLTRLARETAAQVDREVEAMRSTVLAWSQEEALVTDAMMLAGGGAPWAGPADRLNAALALRAGTLGNVALATVVDGEGRLLAAGRSDRSKPATQITARLLSEIIPDPGGRAWIERAATRTGSDTPQIFSTGWHRSPLVAALGDPDEAASYQVGFAARLAPPGDGENKNRRESALVVFFRFETIQSALDRVKQRFTDWEDSRKPEQSRYSSGYAFMFDSDADTVIAHVNRQHYGTSLVRDHHQPEFHQAMIDQRFGSIHYEYPPGTPKITGFAHCAEAADGGFGWIVGVGVSQKDVFADLTRFQELLGVAALILAGAVVVTAALISARITRPLTRLVVLTEQVARGNLDAQVQVTTRDEIAVLADAFNKMAADLKASNHRLIQAEKDAAWREMARQVAHEIKNPLTPIMLSAQQVQRAHMDRHPHFDAILADSVQSIIEQCESLKRIAQNFASYAAFPRPTLEWQVASKLVAKCVAQFVPLLEGKARIVTEMDCPDDVVVKADLDAMRRVFLNLVNNAIEAMAERPEPVLTIAVTVGAGDAGEVARIRVTDNGRGISPSDMRRLFEPYFSTRSSGTGLGLAICRKIVNEHAGSIAVQSELGAGTTFTITLPVRRGDARAIAASDDAFSETRTMPHARPDAP